MTNRILPEFQDFLPSRSLVVAKNAPFYAHTKEKERRNRARVVTVGLDHGGQRRHFSRTAMAKRYAKMSVNRVNPVLRKKHPESVWNPEFQRPQKMKAPEPLGNLPVSPPTKQNRHHLRIEGHQLKPWLEK